MSGRVNVDLQSMALAITSTRPLKGSQSQGDIMKKQLFLFVAPCVLASSAWANFTVVSQDALMDQDLGTTTFSIGFSEALDLNTVDEVGRVASQFQVYVYGDETLSYPEKFAAIIRTADGASSFDNVVVRASVPLTPAEEQDPLSDGWGRVLAVAPMLITNGNTVSFTLKTQYLNPLGNNAFKYEVDTFEYGGYTGDSGLVVSRGSVVPEAGTGLQFMLGAAFIAAALKRAKGSRARATPCVC